MRRGVVLAVVVAVACAGCGGTTAQSALSGRLLSLSDLPAGWRSARVPRAPQTSSSSCLAGLPAKVSGVTRATRGFVLRVVTPSFGETLSSGSRALHEWQLLGNRLSQCRTATVPVAGRQVQATVRPVAFPQIGDRSSAYAWSLTSSGIKVGFDLVLFRTGGYMGELVYTALGRPPLRAVQAFAQAAATKAATGSTARIPDSISIASTPMQTVATPLGTVAYHTVGSGPPLLLIMGYGGTMETWDPRFIDALAQRHSVVIFDNAGIGSTSPRSPLTVDAMADQTSALISALHLGRPDVLGWSMGSMIAQALAVRHPAQVHTLILCAAYPGNGTAVRPAQGAIDDLNSGAQSREMSVLFPAGQSGAQNGYLAALTSQVPAPVVRKGIQTAQAAAVNGWWGGRDTAGSDVRQISAPTLIADGELDRLDPTANSRALVRLIPTAKLLLYPDAGHAFLFQDQAAFVARIESILGAP